MYHLRRNRKRSLTAWIACLAIVLNALVPAFAQAVSGTPGRADVVAAAVCTSEGAGTFAPATAEPSERPSPHGPSLPSAAHCPYCVPAASIGPPCAGPTGWLAAPTVETPHDVFRDGVRPHFALSPAHPPRAPPAI